MISNIIFIGLRAVMDLRFVVCFGTRDVGTAFVFLHFARTLRLVILFGRLSR